MIHTKYLGINWEPGFSGILSFQKFDAEMVSDTRWRQGLKDLNEEKGWSWRMRSNREYLLFWIEIEMWKLLVKSSSPSAEILAYTLQYENYFRVGSPLAVFIAADDFLAKDCFSLSRVHIYDSTFTLIYWSRTVPLVSNFIPKKVDKMINLLIKVEE